jgi:hypothetical protein
MGTGSFEIAPTPDCGEWRPSVRRPFTDLRRHSKISPGLLFDRIELGTFLVQPIPLDACQFLFKGSLRRPTLVLKLAHGI